MSPKRCAKIEKLLLISSLQLLDSMMDELRGGQSGLGIRGGRGTADLLENNLPTIERPETTKALRCSNDGQ
jgi:hypothetical protein